jgi:hypothetical protein
MRELFQWSAKFLDQHLLIRNAYMTELRRCPNEEIRLPKIKLTSNIKYLPYGLV